MKLELSIEEVNQLLIILGEMPTKTMVYPLAIAIKQQADSFMAKESASSVATPSVPSATAFNTSLYKHSDDKKKT